MPAENGSPTKAALRMAGLERQPGRVDALNVTVCQGRNRSAEDRTEDRKPNEVDADKPRLENARHEMADRHGENEEQNGERIAQLVIGRLPEVEWSVVERLDTTSRGERGHGSTGRT